MGWLLSQTRAQIGALRGRKGFWESTRAQAEALTVLEVRLFVLVGPEEIRQGSAALGAALVHEAREQGPDEGRDAHVLGFLGALFPPGQGKDCGEKKSQRGELSYMRRRGL